MAEILSLEKPLSSGGSKKRPPRSTNSEPTRGKGDVVTPKEEELELDEEESHDEGDERDLVELDEILRACSDAQQTVKGGKDDDIDDDDDDEGLFHTSLLTLYGSVYLVFTN